MHTSTDISASLIARNAPRSRRVGIALALICAAAVVQSATAASCPPGYNGTAPHCVPAQAKPRHYTMHSNEQGPDFAKHATAPHAPTPKKLDSSKVGPSIGPGPVEHGAATTSTNTRHARPAAGGHASLNPQPIPPGHPIHRLPPPQSMPDAGVP